MSDTLSPQIRFGSNAGQPATRRDGLAKVTGVATFAADNTPEGLLYAVYAPAKIARGRVNHLDVAAAEAHPGVTHVITPQNRPELQGDPSAKPTMFSFRTEVLQDDTVRYAGQPIAVVLGETLEAATEGARLLAPQYVADPVRVALDDNPATSFEPAGFGLPGGQVTAMSRRGMPLRHAASTSAMRQRRSITMRWKPMRLWRSGTGTG